jgi:hypothetical protein
VTRRGIYVETTIGVDLDRVWSATQDPVEHVRWDARFSTITPTGTTADGATAFTYERTVPLHVIRGTGVSAGEKHGAGGVRTSALKFSTTDGMSPISSGRGYWRYVPRGRRTVFITGYDYVPGWGPLDIFVRPVLGWATAFSFDRLRIWLETGVPPERWPLWSALWWWRPERPRAARCRRFPEAGSRRSDHLADAPARLATLPDPWAAR